MLRKLTRLNVTFRGFSRFRSNIHTRSLTICTKYLTEEKNAASMGTQNILITTTSKTTTMRREQSDNSELDHNFVDVDEIWDIYRQILYNDEVPGVSKINEAGSLNELKEVLGSMNDEDVSKEFVCQAIIVLWDIVRHQVVVQKGPFWFNIPQIETELEKLHKTFIEQPEMTRILEKLQLFLENDTLSFDELSCVLLYLNKLGFPIKSPLLQRIISIFNDKLGTLEARTDVSLSSLSRYVVAICSETGIYPFYACINIIPHIYEHLQSCDNCKSIWFISICVARLVKMISDDILNLYKTKVEELLHRGLLNSSTLKINLKILLNLNFSFWGSQNNELTRNIILLSEHDIPTLQVRELCFIHNFVKSRMEPWNLIPSIVKRSDELLESNPCSHLLGSSLLEMLPEKRAKLTATLENYLLNPDTEDDYVLYLALRYVKPSNNSLCNTFWNKVAQEIALNKSNYTNINRNIYRYMYFNNNSSGTYRNREFERTIMSILFKDLPTLLNTGNHSDFAHAVAFILAYSNNLTRPDAKLDFILDKMESMAEQFNVGDSIMMSRGLGHGHYLRHKFFLPGPEVNFILKVQEILEACAERHLQQPDLTIDQLLIIHTAFNERRNPDNSHLLDKIISKYDALGDFNVNSRIIQLATVNLMKSSYQLPKLFERFIDYINENQQFISGKLLELTLWCFYNVGYVPESEEFLKNANEIIKRNFNYRKSFTIIQSCLALMYLRGLDKELISMIFNINFIKRLEDEIKGSYISTNGPERAISQIMQLNRAVCLDYPELSVPWFHQNFIEAQRAKKTRVRNKFNRDVKKILHDLVKDEKLITENLVTPYGYEIDYVLYLNEKQQFIRPSDTSNTQDITRIAIIPTQSNMYCDNPSYVMKGYTSLMAYHLEILGYKVIFVNSQHWNSMYCDSTEMRLEYIKSLIGLIDK